MRKEVSTVLFKLDLEYFRENFLVQETWGQKHLIYENSTIMVYLENTQINLSDQNLLFEVSVIIQDDKYFKEFFGCPGYSYHHSGSDTFEVPIKHDEYGIEVFVRKVAGSFLDAFRGALYSYRITPIYNKIQELYENKCKKLTAEAEAIYDRSKATTLKKFITKGTFTNSYVNADKPMNEIWGIKNKIEYSSRYELMEKDAQLFYDFLDLEYSPDYELESYRIAVEKAELLLSQQ